MARTSIKNMNIKQGGIFLANLNPIKGHEQAGTRPVIILQNNILNKNLNTVIIIPITSNLSAKDKITTYFLAKNISSLNKDSVALLFQIRTINKNRLTKKISELNKQTFRKLKNQFNFVI